VEGSDELASRGPKKKNAAGEVALHGNAEKKKIEEYEIMNR
jgi:hypothetical protein